MKRKALTRCAGALLLTAALALGGCGSAGAGGTVTNETAAEKTKQYVYQEEEVYFSDINLSNVYNIQYANGSLYMNGGRYEDDAAVLFYAVYDTEGNQLSYAELSFENGGETGISENIFAVGSNGDIYAVQTVTTNSGNEEDYSYNAVQRIVRRAMSDGSEIASADIAMDKNSAVGDYVNQILSDGKGNLVLITSQSVLIYDEELNLVKMLKAQNSIDNAVMLQDGSVAIVSWQDKGIAFQKLDLSNGQFSEAVVPENMEGYSFYAGIGYDLLTTSSDGVYGLNLADNSSVQLMNFVDSDLSVSSIYNLSAVSETEFYAQYYSDSDNSSHYSKFTKVNPEDVKTKITLTMGGIYIDSTLLSRVVSFNKESDDYRIKVTDYSVYNTDDDNTAAQTRMNADLIAGNIPDIIVSNADMPIDSYIGKGLFADLYPFMDGDNGIDKSRYLTNIFDAYAVDGKLYQLVPSFGVSTMVGKTSLVGENQGWSYEQFEQFVAGLGAETDVFSQATRGEVLNNFMQLSGGEFLDWNTQSCKFDTDSFKQFLAFLNTLPETINYDNISEQDWNEQDAVYRNNKAALLMTYVSTFTDQKYLSQGQFGEPITFIGFPEESGNGSAISPSLVLAISSKSANQDAAWSFVKSFLEADYQDSVYNFPVSLDALEKKAADAMQPPYYYDVDGNKVEYNDTYYVGSVEIPIHPMTQEDVDQVMGLLTSLNQTLRIDSSLMNIVTEEAAAYFAGQKTADETAQIIQSRAKIYVEEQE